MEARPTAGTLGATGSRSLRGTRRPPRRAWTTRAVCVLLLLALPAVRTAAEGPRSVRVEMSEFAFRPAVVRLRAGDGVRLVFVNRGQLAHQFETGYLRRVPVTVVGAGLHIDAPGLDVVRLDPGATAAVAFVPRVRGRFPFACTIEGHREAGMQGTIEVR